MISLRFPIGLLIGLTLSQGACARDDTTVAREDARGGTFSLSAERRAQLGAIGSDTLSEAARFLSVLPEADGDAIVFTFADSARGVSSGLGIVDRKAATAQLLWPDSVTRAWWIGPHSLAFATQTGTGVRVVVDVHAAELEVITRGADSGTTALAARPAGDTIEARARATRFLDSIRVQPGGRSPDRSQLTYQVISLHSAPGRAMGVFYAVASDSAGARTNPAWYFIAYGSGQVLPIDEVTGPVSELPENAAAWSEDGRFIYVKGRQIHAATVTER